MTDETQFRLALDAEPNNAGLRLVFADWLEDRGDDRALGYRWMGENGKTAFDWSTSTQSNGERTFDWYFADGQAQWTVPMYCRIPASFRPWFPPGLDFPSYRTRRDAEEAVCRAVVRQFRADALRRRAG